VPAARAASPKALQGPAPSITREEAVALAGKRRGRRSILTPGRSRLVSAEPVGWPVALVGLKYRGGLLGRTVREASFLLDAVYGQLARVHRGLSFRPGFREVMGLPADAVRVLTRLPLSGATPAEMELLAALPREAVTAALKALQERRVVTEAGRAGQARVFIPLLSTRLPSVAGLKGSWDLAATQGAGRTLEVQVTEGELREVLKGIEPTAEVVSFTLVSYPLWELVFADGGRERRVYLDAVTGKEVSTPGPEGK